MVRLWTGDASGGGYGAGVFIKGKLYFRYGHWTTGAVESSSNYREFRNLVESLEDLYNEGKLKNCEHFLFVDNSVADYAYYKGTFSNKALFLLVLRLKKLQMQGDMMIHVIHISGTRMIASGIDILSRGITTEGVMRGMDSLSFVPLHQTVNERSDFLIEWVRSWWGNKHSTIHLTSDEWFSKVFEKVNYLWTPVPAAVDAAIEQLCRNVYLHEDSCHVVCIPRLITAPWKKQLEKVVDFIVTVSFEKNVWPENLSQFMLERNLSSYQEERF